MAARPPDGPEPQPGRPQARQSAPGISFTVDASGLVRTTLHGVITAADLLAHVRARAEAGVLGNPQLVDGRDARLEVSSADLREIATLVGRLRATAGGSRTAFVTPQDHAYGMARVYSALGVRDDPGFAVFRTLAEAESWLAD